MEDKKYGEFNNFDDFFDDLVSELYDSPSEKAAFEAPAPSSEPRSSSRDKAAGHKKDLPAAARVTPSEVTGASEKPRSKKEESGSSSDEAAPPVKPIRKKPEGAGRSSAEAQKPEGAGQTSQKAKKPEASEQVSDRAPGPKGTAFFVVLALVTVLAWCIPLRPTESVSEKRVLDKFPEFSFTTLINGDYFSDIESWFSDTFTFRESWISFSDKVERLYGIKTVAIHGELPTVDAIPIPAPVETAEVDNSEPQEQNTEAPTEEPEIQEEPEEDTWGGMTIDDEALIADRGAKLQIGDTIFVYPGFSQNSAEQYAQLMNKAADLLEGRAGFYSIIAPHSVSAMLTREDRLKYNFVIEDDALEYMYSLMNSNVKKVNVLPILQKHNNEYIYFRSDPHWTAVGAYYAYVQWCEVSGKEPVPLSEYKEYAWEDFYGTYYYASGEPKEIKNNPDTVFAYEPPGDVHLYLDFSNGDGLGEEYPLLMDKSVRKIDQYVTFLTSDEAKATLVNNSIDDDSAVLVLKTSFGNPFVYYLTQHYHTVYVVDMRYYNKRGISSFVDNFNVDDVIMLHATDLCYFADGLDTVGRLIR